MLTGDAIPMALLPHSLWHSGRKKYLLLTAGCLKVYGKLVIVVVKSLAKQEQLLHPLEK